MSALDSPSELITHCLPHWVLNMTFHLLSHSHLLPCSAFHAKLGASYRLIYICVLVHWLLLNMYIASYNYWSFCDNYCLCFPSGTMRSELFSMVSEFLLQLNPHSCLFSVTSYGNIKWWLSWSLAPCKLPSVWALDGQTFYFQFPSPESRNDATTI